MFSVLMFFNSGFMFTLVKLTQSALTGSDPCFMAITVKNLGSAKYSHNLVSNGLNAELVTMVFWYNAVALHRQCELKLIWPDLCPCKVA